MKKFLVKILVFLALFVLLNVGYLGLVSQLDWNFKKVLEARNQVSNDYETLVFGNSLAMDGINTEILGKAYNFAIGGATLTTNEYQLKNYLNHAGTKPKRVIIGMASCIGENYNRSTLHPIIRYLDKNKFDSLYDLPLIQFKWMAAELAKKIVSKPHRQAHLVDGQLRISRVVPDHSEIPKDADSTFYKNYYNEIKALSRIDSLLSEEMIDLVVIEMPGVKSSQNEIPIGPYEVEGYQVYNFNNREFCKIFNSDEHWLGGSHLNMIGAEVFTKAMKDILQL